MASSSSVLAQQSPISLGRCGRAEAIALVHRVDLARTQSRREAESLTDAVSCGSPVRLCVRQSFRPSCRHRSVLTDSAANSGRASIDGRTNRRTFVRDALRLTITERHCMPNPSLPSHLLDWLWIGLSTGPNGAAAEMIPSSIAASAYWRGWTLKAWRYFLSRLLQGVRKGAFSDSHNNVVSLPVRLEPLLRFNILAAPSMTARTAGRAKIT